MSLLSGDDAAFWIFPSVLPPRLCDLLADEGAALPTAPGAVGHADAGLRRSSVAFFPVRHWVGGLVDRYLWEANAAAGWDFTLHASEPVQHAVYGVNDHYGWHVDTFPQAGTTRKLSATVQLDDGDTYVGGDLQLRHPGTADLSLVPLPPSARARGTVLVFPSFLLHRVTPVTAGQRRSLVAWVRGPRFT